MRIFTCSLSAIPLRLVYDRGYFLLIRNFNYQESYSILGSWLLSQHRPLSLPNCHYADNCSQWSLKVILSNFYLMLCSFLLSLPSQKSKEQRNCIHDRGISPTRKSLSNDVLSVLERGVKNLITVNYFSTDKSSLAYNQKIFGSVACDSTDSDGISNMIATLILSLLALESGFSVYPYRFLAYRRQDLSYVI
jgi:hypothetical protein